MENKDMTKINYDNFIKFLVENANTNDFKNALASQGLYFDNDELKQIEYRPKFKIGDILTDGSLTFIVKELDLFNNLYSLENNFGYKTKLVFSYVDKEYHLIEKDIKPKFKEGDWIYHNNGYRGPYLITNINEHGVELNNNIRIKIEDCYDNHHLWTIEDAKDGDVLINYEDKCQFIFKGLLDPNHPNCPVAYCGIDDIGVFRVSSGNYWWEDSNVKPATKEQHDALMKAMTDAGWKFDFNKKELRKIEQKPTWSEDDEKMLVDAYVMLDWYKGNNWWTARRIKDWLNSLKERIGG